MNFKEASDIAYARYIEYTAGRPYDDAGPDDECTDDRCVKGKCCPECNEEWEQNLEYKKEYTGDEDDQ